MTVPVPWRWKSIWALSEWPHGKSISGLKMHPNMLHQWHLDTGIVCAGILCFTTWLSMGSFLRKQPSYLFILIILHLVAHGARTLSSDGMWCLWLLFVAHFFSLVQNANTHWYSTGEALLAFKKAVTNSDGVFLNWREQDADPCNWKGVRCDSHSKRVINL